LDDVNSFHLFKKHWKLPFRDSPYNIRRKEKKITTEENNDHFISGFADWKGTKLEGMQKPEIGDLKLASDGLALDSPEKLAQLWSTFEDAPK